MWEKGGGCFSEHHTASMPETMHRYAIPRSSVLSPTLLHIGKVTGSSPDILTFFFSRFSSTTADKCRHDHLHPDDCFTAFTLRRLSHINPSYDATVYADIDFTYMNAGV